MPLPVSPTILLAVASIALLCGRSLPVRMSWIAGWVFLAAGFSACYFLAVEPIVTLQAVESSTSRSAWKNDGLAISEQWIVLAFGLLVGISVFDSPSQRHNSCKFGGFLLFALAGMMLVAAANDFLTLALALEVVNLAVVALYKQLDLQPVGDSTATPKDMAEVTRSANVWISWLSSALMWLGIALLSNATATTNFDGLRSILTVAYDPSANQSAIGAPSKLILLASGLIAMSLFARMGLVPFHLSLFAAVQRQSSWRSLCLLMTSQITGAIALSRLFGYLFVGLSQSFVVLAIVVVLATFSLSATIALRGLSAGTRSIVDLVISLMLLQAGWLVIGSMIVSVELDHFALRWGAFPKQPESVAIILFTQVTSLLAGCGIYGALSYLARTDRRIEFLEDVKGLGRFAPMTSIALLLPLASIAACPWTAGFWGRWMLLLAGHNVHVKSTSSIMTPHYGIRLAIFAGVLTTMAFVAVVLRLVREMFLESPLARQAATGGRGPLIVSLITAVASLLLGFAPQLLIGPLKLIQSPRTASPRDPERGSGRNSLGMRAKIRGQAHVFEDEK